MSPSKLARSLWKDWLVSASVSNLLLYNQWSRLDLQSSSRFNQYQYAAPYSENYIAMILNWLLLSVVFFPLVRATESKNRIIGRTAWALLLALVVFALNDARKQLRGATGLAWLAVSWWREHLGFIAFLLLAVAIAIATIALLIRLRENAPAILRIGLTILFPVAIVHVGWAIVHGNRLRPSPVVEGPQLGPRPSAPQRLVWIILDTLELRSVFGDRPEDLHVPEMDRLRAEGLFAESAYSPAARTQYSLPALLTGKVVRLALPAGQHELNLTFDGERESRRFSTVENIFSHARERGLRSGLVGWFHPYCRMIAWSLDDCFYHSANELWEDHPVPDVLANMAIHLRALLPRKSPNVSVDAHEHLSRAAERMVADESLDLVFLHLSIPHMPWIYNRKTKTTQYMGEKPDSVEGYFGNVELADQTVGLIRRSLEKNGLWDRTAILVSSDHWWWYFNTSNQPYRPRPGNDFRIPYLLRLPGDHAPISLTTPFNTVLSHDLVLEILSGTIRTPEQAARWLEQNESRFPIEPVLETRIFG